MLVGDTSSAVSARIHSLASTRIECRRFPPAYPFVGGRVLRHPCLTLLGWGANRWEAIRGC